MRRLHEKCVVYSSAAHCVATAHVKRHCQNMKRVLLLIPTTTYRTQAFLDAAKRLGVEIAVGSERPNVLEKANPSGLLTLNFLDPEKAAQTVIEFSEKYPISTVVGVDDQTTVVAATISAALSLPHNSVSSVSAARNKYLMRELLSKSNIPQPRYSLFSIYDDPRAVARRVNFPCVVKPLILAASRGVIRANDESEFVSAYGRIKAILQMPDVVQTCQDDSAYRQLLVENYIPGEEVTLEGLLSKGKLRILAIFDKPDPLEGPFFEETIYVTPSQLPLNVQEEITSCANRATRALGLEEGPIHAELRINEEGPWVIEIAARSIGGFCSRALRFSQTNQTPLGDGISLEELILRHALGMETNSLQRESKSSGVMMIPIPQAGILNEVKGLQEAKEVKGIEDILISAHLDEKLVPLPEGSKYLGFIFARAESPKRVEATLREAHRQLEFVIIPKQEALSNVEQLERKNI